MYDKVKKLNDLFIFFKESKVKSQKSKLDPTDASTFDLRPKSTSPSPAPNRTGRTLVITFYTTLIFFTLGTTWIAIHHPKTQAYKQGNLVPLTLCTEVINGHSIKVQNQDKEEIVHFLGIESPGENPTKLSSQLDPNKEEQIARHALLAWIYHKRVRLTYPHGKPTHDERGRLLAYVDIYGIDVGKKMLQEGQAMVSDKQHPKFDLYKKFEAEAYDAHKGVWRR